MAKSKPLTNENRLITAHELKAMEQRFIRAMSLMYKLLKEEPKK